MKPSPFSSEAELCDTFADKATEAGWTVYPECDDWDLLLVRGDVQVGVQAKLRANIYVLYQAVAHYNPARPAKGPLFHAVLIGGKISLEFADIARRLNLLILSPYQAPPILNPHVYGWAHNKPAWIPPYVPDLPAGVPSPICLTPWKVAALELCKILREKGYVTSKDMKTLKLASSTWVGRWLKNSGEKEGRLVKYVAKPGVKLPDEKFNIAIKAKGENNEGPTSK